MDKYFFFFRIESICLYVGIRSDELMQDSVKTDSTALLHSCSRLNVSKAVVSYLFSFIKETH